MGYNDIKRVVGRSEYKIGEEVFADAIYKSDVIVDGFLADDERAFRGEDFSLLHVSIWRKRLQFRMAYKSPYRNEKGKIIGAVHTGYEIVNPPLHNIKQYMAMEDKGLLEIPDESKLHIDWYINKFLKEISLSARELECVTLLSKGNTTREVALQLKLSQRTVESYLANAKNKLGCRNNYDLIACCIHKGWIDWEF